MFESGSDDQEEPGPPEPGAPGPGAPGSGAPGPGSWELGAPGPGSSQPGGPVSGPGDEGVAGWPVSGLPPSFGQRSAAGEQPAAAGPELGSGCGGYRPLGSLPPSGPLPSAPAERGPDQPEQHGPDQPEQHGSDQPELGAESGPQAAFDPWETYE